MDTCKIVYVKQSGQAGWRWQALSRSGSARVSEQTYPLYYECVLAARAKGLAPFPALKCS